MHIQYMHMNMQQAYNVNSVCDLKWLEWGNRVNNQ